MKMILEICHDYDRLLLAWELSFVERYAPLKSKVDTVTKKEKLMRAAYVAAIHVVPGASLIDAISQILLSGSDTIDEHQEDSPVDAQTIARDQARTMLTFQQAQVARELAIARRIDTAEEVEIEEFFDISGKGQMGLQTQESGLSMGISGEGKKLSRRIYRFKGWRDGGLETLMADLGGLTPDELESLRKLVQMDAPVSSPEQ
ncbi:hypothetical protein [Deinococcus marmoris]|uniref:hypothetical protein n=1 Tax=Deinococcus marmoris TaxID=249408 RepID=UPI0011152074|nr:hypothetical protein [Deinococcus marmoris]